MVFPTFTFLLVMVADSASTTNKTMKALVAPSYVGSNFSLLKVHDFFPAPAISSDAPFASVRINVKASSINPVDWKLIESKLFPGMPAHFPAVLGMDCAGIVEEVSPSCTRLKVGDKVWADLAEDNLGGFGQIVVAQESHVGIMPKNLSFVEAASLPLVSMTGMAALKFAGAPWGRSSNLTVMVLGGSGGCGSTGIQLALAWGAMRVYTTTSKENFDFVLQLGASKAFDYKNISDDWVSRLGADSVDIVYDTVGVEGSADHAMRAIKPGGYFISIAGDLAKAPKSGVKQKFIEHWPKDWKTIEELTDLVNRDLIKPSLEQVFSLAEIPKAFAISKQGQVRGKLGVRIV